MSPNINTFWGEEDHSGDIVPFSVHPVRKPMMLKCSISGDVGFDHVVKVLSSRRHLYKASNSFFVMSKYLVARFFEMMQISCFSSYFCLLILVTIVRQYFKKYTT